MKTISAKPHVKYFLSEKGFKSFQEGLLVFKDKDRELKIKSNKKEGERYAIVLHYSEK